MKFKIGDKVVLKKIAYSRYIFTDLHDKVLTIELINNYANFLRFVGIPGLFDPKNFEKHAKKTPKKKTISIHIKDGVVKDVEGIPSNVKLCVLYLDNMKEVEYKNRK